MNMARLANGPMRPRRHAAAAVGSRAADSTALGVLPSLDLVQPSAASAANALIAAKMSNTTFALKVSASRPKPLTQARTLMANSKAP